MNPRQLNVDLQFCGNSIFNVIPETLNKFTLQRKMQIVSGFSKQKEHNSLSIMPKPANCTFITRDRKFNLISKDLSFVS